MADPLSLNDYSILKSPDINSNSLPTIICTKLTNEEETAEHATPITGSNELDSEENDSD